MSDAGKPDKITISDVARLASVSKAVASRALSPERRPVSADKRERVLAAAAELGFRANLLAQSLTTKSVNLIAVVVNHIHDLSDLDLFDLLIRETQLLGKQVIILRVGADDRPEDLLRQSIAYHVDAALVFSDFADAATVRQMFRSDHVVMLNRRHDRLSPAIEPDDAQGIGDAVAHAASRGTRRAVLVTGRATSLVEEARVSAYQQAFAVHGIELVSAIPGDYSYRSGQLAAAQLPAADAVFCTSDAMAMGLLDVHRAAFVDAATRPFDLYGFDNLSLLDFAAYPIASIGYDKAAFVREMLRLTIEPTSFTPGQPPVSVPTRFVLRDTAA